MYLYVCLSKLNEYAVDVPTIKKSSIVTEWVKQTGNISYFDDEKEILLKDGHQLSLYMYDCEKRRSKLIVGIVYDSKGAVKMSLEREHYQVDWITVIPDSVGESLLEYACNMYN